MDNWQYRSTTILADLGPLPEVVESKSDTAWKMFLELQEQHTDRFSKTVPSSPTRLIDHPAAADRVISVQDVMTEARRHSRVCPVQPEWQRLHELLVAAAGADAPAAITGAERRTTPPLVKRVRLRDQVEWAARHGVLQEVFAFLEPLPEDHWVHMAW